MMWNQLSRYVLVAAGGVWLAVGACERRDQPDATGGIDRLPNAADTAPVGVEGGADTAGGAPPDRLTDANIVALLDEANRADSAAGAFAAAKATDSEVKAYAKLMMSEHHALRVQGQQLARRLGVTPEAPPNDPVASAAKDEMAALRSAAKGAEFDRTYIDQEVAVHKAVIDLAEQAHEATRQEDLKALIVQAKPVLQKHLEQAEKIQKRLGRPSD